MGEMVSVIIPTYNRANVVARAIESVLEQTYPYFELIIVDDGSTDDTKQVVESFQDERIRYIVMPENGGASAARNEGIRQAKYDYIAFQDSDDYWLPEKLEEQMYKMTQASEKTGLVYCRMRGKGIDGEMLVCPEESVPLKSLEGDMLPLLMRENVIGAPTMLFRRKCLEQLGGFDENLRCIEDWELVLRVAERWEIGLADEILVEITRSENSVSGNIRGYLEVRCYMISKYWQLMAEENLLEGIMKEILILAKRTGYYEETKRMLMEAIRT
jgi:glycosyltransferase involved in cell wall biosynthesis